MSNKKIESKYRFRPRSLKTIREILDIEITVYNGIYIADAKCFSGTPFVGRGKSEYEALYDLLAQILFSSSGPMRHNAYFDIAVDKIKKYWESIWESII